MFFPQESAVGFDTAVKVYSQLVGNTAIDGASARKYWYFMRLMGQVRGTVGGDKRSARDRLCLFCIAVHRVQKTSSV